MIRIRVLFFASLREKARARECEQELEDGQNIRALWHALLARYPAIEPLGASLSFAVNQEYADRDQVLRDGDEVALIPPVSGGS